MEHVLNEYALSNRMSDQVMGSAVGVRCARSFSTGQPDPTPALAWVTLSGRVDREDGAPSWAAPSM